MICIPFSLSPEGASSTPSVHSRPSPRPRPLPPSRPLGSLSFAAGGGGLVTSDPPSLSGAGAGAGAAVPGGRPRTRWDYHQPSEPVYTSDRPPGGGPPMVARSGTSRLAEDDVMAVRRLRRLRRLSAQQTWLN